MKRKRLHKIIALESADDKVRKQQRVWGKRRKRRREDKEPKVHDTSYLRFTHKSTERVGAAVGICFGLGMP